MFARKVFFLHLFLISIILSGFYSAHAANWGTIFIDYPFPNFSSSAGSYSSIAIDSTDKIHITYHDDSGKLKYATNLSGKWVTSTVDSLGKVGSYCSIAIDSQDVIHISYYDITNWDLKYATNGSGEWVTTTVDSDGNVGQYSSIVSDLAGRIHISYFDFTNGNLKYAIRDNGGWNIKTLDDNGRNGLSASIAADSFNKIHISYVEDKSNYLATYPNPPYTYRLKYITNKSGEWSAETVYAPAEGAESAYAMYSAVRYIHTSIAIDKANSVHIAFHHPQFKDLFYATNNSGSWVVTKLVEIGDTGFYPSICVDSGNKVHISYYDITKGILKHISNSTGPWISETVDASVRSGIYSSVTLDSSNTVHISYTYSRGGTSSFLKYANNTIPTHQIGPGTWSYSTTGNWVSGSQSCLAEINETANVTLTRDGNNVSIVLDDGLKFTGMLVNDQLTLSASFSEYPLPDRILPISNTTFLADGLMTFFVDLTAASSKSLSGTISWSYVFDENLQCNGGSTVTVTAITVVPPEINSGVVEPTGGVIEQRHTGLPWLMLLLKK